MIKDFFKQGIILLLMINFIFLPAVKVKGEQRASSEPAKEVKSEYTGPKRKVAVIDFENKTKYGERRLGNAASDILITELGKTGKFILIEREKLNKVLEEQKLGMTGIIDPNTIATVGKILGLDAIITGSISQFGTKTVGTDFLITQSKSQIAEATVDIRVVDIETARIIYTDSGKGVSSEKHSSFLGMGTRGGYAETIEGNALRAAITKFSENVATQISKRPWSCRVADVSEGEIYLDAGQESGLKLETVLVVYELGKEIISPDTGIVIGRRQTKAGMIKVLEYFGENGSIAMLVEGNLPKPGSLCKMCL